MAKPMEDRLRDVYGAGGDQSVLNDLYDDWARDYEKDHFSTGNPRIALTVGLTVRHIPDTDARILDSGCGTGILAAILQGLGYTQLVGIDGSDGMLEVSAARNCYSELHKMLLGADLDFPDESFDAVIATGVLATGHAPPDCLDGILGIARPGAPIIFSISEATYDEYGYREKIAALEAAGAWAPVEKGEKFQPHPLLENHDDVLHWLDVYRKGFTTP